MKKTILLITTAFLCTNVHAGNGNGPSRRTQCTSSISSLNSRISEIQTALSASKNKINQASTKLSLVKTNSGTALDYKQCIFYAYDSFPLLLKPSGYENEPTAASTVTEEEMQMLKAKCESAIILAQRKIEQTQRKLTGEMQEKLSELQEIANNTSLSADAAEFITCKSKATEAKDSLQIINTAAARAQVDQDLMNRANEIYEKMAVEQARREFEQQQPVLIPQWRTLLLGASPSAADTTRFNALIQGISIDKRQNVIDILTLVIKKADNKTRKINSEKEGSVVILDLMDQLKSKSLPQTEEIKTCAKELIADDMYKHIAYGIIRGITYLPDAKRTEVVEAVKNFSPIMSSSRKTVYTTYTLMNLYNMQDQWENIFRRAKEFMTSKMEDSAATSILSLMKNNIPTVEKREAVVMAMKQVTHKSDGKLRSGATDKLISDVCTKAQNPEKWTELMSKITDRLTDELTLPQAVEIMKNPDTAPDAVSNTVRDRGA